MEGKTGWSGRPGSNRRHSAWEDGLQIETRDIAFPASRSCDREYRVFCPRYTQIKWRTNGAHLFRNRQILALTGLQLIALRIHSNSRLLLFVAPMERPSRTSLLRWDAFPPNVDRRHSGPAAPEPPERAC